MFTRQTLLFCAICLFSLISSVVAAEESLISSRPPGDWTLSEGVSLNGKILTVNISEAKKKGFHYGIIRFDLTKHRGKDTTFSIRMRNKGFVRNRKDKSRHGVQFKLSYVRPNGKRAWHHTWDTWDNTDWSAYSGEKKDGWREISFLSKLDSDVSAAEIWLGTANNSGNAEFDLRSFRAYQLFPESKSKYTCEYSSRVKNMPVLRGVTGRVVDFTEEDFKTLKKWNVNLLRYPFIAYAWVFDGKNLDELRRRIDKRLKNFDKACRFAKQYGVRLIVCYAMPPGGRLSDATLAMQTNRKYAECYWEMWERIAKHCKGRKVVWAYDLINEPSQKVKLAYDYWNIQRIAAEKIRAIDPEVPVIIESNLLAAPDMFRILEPLKMKDVIYQLHMYIPAEFTHSTMAPYPGKINNKYWDKKELRKVLQPVVDFQKRHGARIYTGEFSTRSRSVGAERYLRDCIELFEEFGWDWTYHSFREAPTWNLEMEELNGKYVPSSDNPRKRVLLKAFQKNIKK